MLGKHLRSQARSFVAKLIQYFTTERDNGSPFLSLCAIDQRVADALGISLRTVCSIRACTDKNESLGTPGTVKRKQHPKTVDLPEEIKLEVRNLVYDTYKDKKHITLRSLKRQLATKQILDANINSISKLLAHLGFKYKQDDNRRALMEQSNIVLQRAEFFRRYFENHNATYPRQIVFLDETWIFAKGSRTRSWQDATKESVRKPEGYKGKRFIVLHAGHCKGFVDNSSLIYSTKSKLADYHGDMNGDIFMKWLRDKLVPNLEEPFLIVMGNAPYHSVLLEKQPTSSWKKCEITEWLQKSNINCDASMFKAELLDIAKRHKKPPRYKVDEFLQESGHEVLRLPPFHCQFNAIEMIWADAKRFYNDHIGEDGYGDDKVLAMWEKALAKCTPETWSAKIRKTEKIIEEWYNREHVLDNIPPIIINLNAVKVNQKVTVAA